MRIYAMRHIILTILLLLTVPFVFAAEPASVETTATNEEEPRTDDEPAPGLSSDEPDGAKKDLSSNDTAGEKKTESLSDIGLGCAADD